MLDAIWGIFFQILSWMIYPSSQNPVLPVLGVVITSIILVGFLRIFGFFKRYPDA